MNELIMAISLLAVFIGISTFEYVCDKRDRKKYIKKFNEKYGDEFELVQHPIFYNSVFISKLPTIQHNRPLLYFQLNSVENAKLVLKILSDDSNGIIYKEPKKSRRHIDKSGLV